MDYTIAKQIKKKESLDYLEGFRDAAMFIMDNLSTVYVRNRTIRNLTEAIERTTEDYTNEILAAMECHEASTHFEDFMNEPIESQTSDSEVSHEK